MPSSAGPERAHLLLHIRQEALGVVPMLAVICVPYEARGGVFAERSGSSELSGELGGNPVPAAIHLYVRKP